LIQDGASKLSSVPSGGGGGGGVAAPSGGTTASPEAAPAEEKAEEPAEESDEDVSRLILLIYLDGFRLVRLGIRMFHAKNGLM
jgi:hypothetical protein